MKKFAKRILTMGICAILISSAILFSACDFFFSSNDIFSVRERAEERRLELTENLVAAFKDRDVVAAKALFCEKSQNLPDLEAQIEATFAFPEGEIQTVTPNRELGGESYANEYGTVVAYSFYGDARMTTDAGRKYRLTFHVYEIVEGEEIQGMTSYTISEDDRDYENTQRCRAGYNWSSPYDSECGVLSANLILAVQNGDAEGVKALLCAHTLEKPELEEELSAAFAFFQGKSTFTVREDGLYDSYDENEISCQVLGYGTDKGEGEPHGVWVNVLAWVIKTDAGRQYRLDFTAFLYCDEGSEWDGITYFSIEDMDSKERITVGEWASSGDIQ